MCQLNYKIYRINRLQMIWPSSPKSIKFIVFIDDTDNLFTFINNFVNYISYTVQYMSIIMKQPDLERVESQGPVSDSKLWRGESEIQFFSKNKKEPHQQKEQNNHQEVKNPVVQLSKKQSENPINLSQFKDEKPFDISTKVEEKDQRENAKDMRKSKESYLNNKNILEEQQYMDHPYTPQENLANQKMRVISIESEEVINNQGSQISNNEKIASGIVIRIKNLQILEQSLVPQKIYIEIRNETNMNVQERQNKPLNTKKTKVVNRNDPVWDDNYYYNNDVVLDDNITFILKQQDNKQIARRQERNLSRLRLNQGEINSEGYMVVNQKLKLKQKNKEQGQVVANLVVQITFYERQDILGGCVMPNLSLKPAPGFVGRYNAVDKYQPTFTNKLGSKANCFNFFDGQTIPGFDTIQVFPPKFVKKNKHKKVIAAQ